MLSALNHCMNEKNLIHGRVMATISKFNAQIFETYCKYSGDLWQGSPN